MVDDLSSAAQKVVYTIRHVIAERELNDGLALRHARGLILQPMTGVSTTEAYAALNEALASNVRLSTWHGDPRAEQVIDENEFRAHLRRVVRKLDEMRPWHVPLFRPLEPTVRWNTYAEWRPVGKLDLIVPVVENRIHVDLLPMGRPIGDGQVRVAVLELRSGREVALVGRWWPDEPRVTAVLTCDPDASAADLMAELTSGSHFAPGEYEILDAPGPV